MAIRDTDLELLELFFWFRELPTHYIIKLLPNRSQSKSSGVLSTLERLASEPHYLLQRFDRESLYHQYWYSITDKGRAIALEHGVNPAVYANTHRWKGCGTPRLPKPHQKGVYQVMGDIFIGARDHGVHVIMQSDIEARWTADTVDRLPRECRKDPHNLPFSTHHVFKASATYSIDRYSELRNDILRYDGIFGLQYAPEQISFFAVEYQNTCPLTAYPLGRDSSLRKFLGYQDIIKKKTYRQLGIPNLHILFIFATEARMMEALRLAESVLDKDVHRWFRFGFLPGEKQLKHTAHPTPEFFTTPLLRPGLEPKALFTAL